LGKQRGFTGADPRPTSGNPARNVPAFARYQLKIEPLASAAIEDLVVWLGPTVQRYLTDPNP
jgi:hypothetical protein